MRRGTTRGHTCTPSPPRHHQVLRCSHLSQQVTVKDLEHFVEAKLAEPLHGVADEGGGPSLGQASNTVLLHRHREAVADAFVFVWVDLRKGNT